MPIENLIINGSFDIDEGDTGFTWTGNDFETENTEGTYQSGGDGTDSVAEMDGESGQTTVMQQTFTITEPITTTLTLEAGGRDSSGGNSSPGDGFRVDILDSSNNVIATMNVTPTAASMSTFSLPVTFTASGDYTLVLTELGDDDSFGVIVDDIELLVCFCRDTMIDTPDGTKKVQDIKAGDLVATESGPQQVRWVGNRMVSAEELSENEKLQPVNITAGALGNGTPNKDLRVSRQHRMLANGPIVKRMFDQDKVLISAIKLTDLPGIFVDETALETEYFHLLFDQHEVVVANGAQSESLHTGPEALQAMSPDSRQEILTLFPQLQDLDYSAPTAAHIPEGRRQKRLVARHSENRKPIFSPE